jgi:hypothetical protein
LAAIGRKRAILRMALLRKPVDCRTGGGEGLAGWREGRRELKLVGSYSGCDLTFPAIPTQLPETAGGG